MFGNDPDADKDRFAPKAGSAVPVPNAKPTDEEEEEKKNQAAGGAPNVQTSVKVRAPPGGASSISFG